MEKWFISDLDGYGGTTKRSMSSIFVVASVYKRLVWWGIVWRSGRVSGKCRASDSDGGTARLLTSATDKNSSAR
jgi:hypothetical protein